MNKAWSYEVHALAIDGEFVIKQRDGIYSLFFYAHSGSGKQTGNEKSIHDARDMQEIMSYLVSQNYVEIDGIPYPIDMSSVDIPTKIEEWTVRH